MSASHNKIVRPEEHESDNEVKTPQGLPSSRTLSQPQHQRSRVQRQPVEVDGQQGDDARKQAVVVVDPMSTGAVLAYEFMKRMPCIRVLSRDFPPAIANCVLPGLKLDWAADIRHNGDIRETVEALHSTGYHIVSSVAGCETGVEFNDELAQLLDVPHNDPQFSLCRRNKYEMVERIRECGIRAMRQLKASEWSQVEAFLRQQEGSGIPFFPAVIKPVQSSGTDGVYLCASRDELQRRFHELVGHENMLGEVNEAVVVQEYLRGREYVVDTVTHNGHHKVVALWCYDKRPANGVHFVYFGLKLISADEEPAQVLINYTKSVLDALHISEGPGHCEVILTDNGPVMVEVGARPHGGEGAWLPIPNRCLGYNMCSVMVDAVMDEQAWNDIPDVPLLTTHFGAELCFVSFTEGRIKAIRHLPEVTSMKSYLSHTLWNDLSVGSALSRTVDLMSVPGSVMFVSEGKEQLDRDMKRFHQLNEEGFFEVEEAESDEGKSSADPQTQDEACDYDRRNSTGQGEKPHLATPAVSAQPGSVTVSTPSGPAAASNQSSIYFL